MLAKLDLQRARMEYNNKYVFGWDDARRVIEMEISKLTPQETK